MVIDLGKIALLSASAAAIEGTKQQSTTNNVEVRVSANVGTAGGGRWALDHDSLHYF